MKNYSRQNVREHQTATDIFSSIRQTISQAERKRDS